MPRPFLLAATLLFVLCPFLHAVEPAGKPIRVACVGDSITFGATADDPATQSYPARLQELLGEGYAVKNFGVGGYALLRKVDHSVWKTLESVKAFEPQVVVVMLGTNDTRFWEHNADFEADYHALIDELTALRTGPKVVICTPIDILPEVEGLAQERAERLKGLRVHLAELCERIPRIVKDASDKAPEHSSRNLVLVPLAGMFQDKPELLPDGVHPKAEGYRMIAERLIPHVKNVVLRPEGSGIILFGGGRSLEESDRLIGEIPEVNIAPPADRCKRLPGTKKRLQEGPELRIVMLGDSIINDTSRSGWENRIERLYPKCNLVKITSVRGSTGCWYYKTPPRIQTFVLDFEPDLVIIGGISQRHDVDSIRECLKEIRQKRPETEFLLLSGPFGQVDPCDDAVWAEGGRPDDEKYRDGLKSLADEFGCEFYDIQKDWGEYVRRSGKKVDDFKRDVVHANAHGEQVLSRLLEGYLSP